MISSTLLNLIVSIVAVGVLVFVLRAPSKPLETTGESGANGAPPVQRVAPRTDLSNARS